MIDLFVNLPKITKDAKPVEDTIQKKKTIFSRKTKTDQIISIEDLIEEKKKKFNKYDPGYDKKYDNFHYKRIDDIKKSEEELMNSLNSKLPVYIPDTKVDDLQFLQERLFTREEIKDYFETAKKQNYNLGSKIIGWSERLHEIVIKEIDDINGDNNPRDENLDNNSKEDDDY